MAITITMFDNVLQLSSFICSSVALLLNMILCPIILFRSDKQLGQYKYLLLSFVILESMFGTGQLLLFPVIQGTDNFYYTYAWYQFAPRWISQIFLYLFQSVAPLIPVILAFSFLYRYGIVCSPELHAWFMDRKKRVVFFVVFLVTLMTTGGCIVLFMEPSENKKTQLEECLLGQGMNLTGRAWLALRIYHEDRSMTKDGIFSLLCFMPTYYWCFAVYGFTTTKIIKFFKSKNLNLSDRSLHGQKQLFRMLILQTITPLCTLFTPISAAVLLAFLSMDVGELNQYNSFLFSFAALIDPFIIFYYIPQYRRAVKQFIIGKESQSSKVEPTMTDTTHNAESVVP